VCAAAVVACDTAFIEPNPPVLVAGERVLESGVGPEPVVHGAILDLHVPDVAACSAAQARLTSTLASAASATGQPVRLLTAIDLSPGCTQLPGRTLPIDALDAEIRAAELEFPGRRIRAVLVYANNVDLQLPWSIVSGLDALRSRVVARGGLRPLVYGLVTPAVWSPMFDATIAWTWSGDEAMWAALASHLASVLPLQTLTPATVQAPLLAPDVAARAVAVKICGVTGSARVAACPAFGAACAVGSPAPEASAWFAAFEALPRSSAPPPARASVTYEAYTARCDRYLELASGLEPWNVHQGCVTEGAP
jgi:hypothetical protein